MQLISSSPELRIDIRAEESQWSPKKEFMGTTKPLFVKFFRGGNVPEHVKALADQLPGLRQGIGPEGDPYLDRIGWWDSYAAQKDYDWSDEEREFVEQRILQIGDPNVLVVEAPRVPAPYAKYDAHRRTQGQRKLEHVLADIAQTYEVAGFDVEQAVAYEQQNLADERVIEALRALAPEGVEEVVAA